MIRYKVLVLVSVVLLSFGIESFGREYEVTSPDKNLMLKVEYLIRMSQSKEKLVVIDSINSLAIHNSNWILSEFLHVLVSGLRSREAYTVIFTVEEHTTPEISNMVSLVCDHGINAGKKEE